MRDGIRISVVGTSGAGKSTLAKRAARRLGVPHVELDALRHGPGWVETPDPEFRRLVTAQVEATSWIIDGNYGVVRDLVWQRATTIVWVDPALAVVMAQVLWRSVSRAITREELWNGNRERASEWLKPDHPIRWAWRTHPDRRLKFEALWRQDPRWVRLRTRSQARAWLQSLA